MPGGDRTGPAGMGPMTGRAAGYCAGYSVPGFTNPIPGRYAAPYAAAPYVPAGAPYGAAPNVPVAVPYGYGGWMPYGAPRFGRGFGRGRGWGRGFGRGFGRGRGRGFGSYGW